MPTEHSQWKSSEDFLSHFDTIFAERGKTLRDDQLRSKMLEHAMKASLYGISRQVVREHLKTLGIDVTPEALPPWISEIVSTDRYSVLTHRTTESNARNTFDTGFWAGASLEGTTLASSRDEQEAFTIFEKIHHARGVVLFIRIPKSVFNEIQMNREKLSSSDTEGGSLMTRFEELANEPPLSLEEYVLDRFYDTKKGQIVIPTMWIYGFADQTNFTLVKNPNYDPNFL